MYVWVGVLAQTMGLMFNALVHVFMYFYFALTVYMAPPWWKKFITTGQIIQFQSSFVLALPFFYIHIKEVYVEGGPGCEVFSMLMMYVRGLFITAVMGTRL
jgi:hypothetical protein